MLVKVKKLYPFLAYFVILLTFIFLVSCKSKNYYNYKVEGSKVNINQKYKSDEKIEKFISPYRTRITKDLDSVLAHCPETLDKSKGKWESTIGLFLANVTNELANPIFEKREKKSIDMVLLNHGGIRSTIPKGAITSRTAFNVMPFENSIIVVELSGAKIEELANYVLEEKKPHPMYGIKIYANKKNELTEVKINNIKVETNKKYNVATSDYLANGGDNMIFFKESKTSYPLDYKLRNLLIDYFKKVDTLAVFKEQIVIIED